MSANMIDPSKVKAGDTVTVAGTNTAHLEYTVTGVVWEPSHSPGQLWVGPVALDATTLTITDHQPAKPEWAPGTFGTATVSSADSVTPRTVKGVLGPDGMFAYATDDVVDVAEAGQWTDFVPAVVPEQYRPMAPEWELGTVGTATISTCETSGSTTARHGMWFRRGHDEPLMFMTDVGSSWASHMVDSFVPDDTEALRAEVESWRSRYHESNRTVEDLRTEAQAAREVSVSERERAEEFSRQVEEEHERVDGLRKKIASLHLKVSAFEREHVIDMSRVKEARRERDKALVDSKAANRSHDEMIAKFHLIRCENDKLRTKLEEARKAALPTDLTKCACHPHTQDAGAGFTEYLLEYEPACPLHSKHVYDPRQGMWIESASRTMPTRKQVRTVLAYQYDNYIDGCFIGRAREDFLDDATDRVRSLFEPVGAASTPDFKKDNS